MPDPILFPFSILDRHLDIPRRVDDVGLAYPEATPPVRVDPVSPSAILHAEIAKARF